MISLKRPTKNLVLRRTPALQLTRNKLDKIGLVILALVIPAGILPWQEAAGQGVMYTVSELPGGGVPCRLNNFGDLAGRAGDNISGGMRAARWNRGALRRRILGKLQGGDYSAAYGINDSGEVAGSGNVTDSTVPFLWISGAGFRRIPLLAGDNCGQALAVNRYRHVTGYSSGPTGQRAFLWTQSTGVRNLGVLPGGNYSSGRDINDADEVVGTSGSATGEHAVVWLRTGDIVDLGTLPGDTSSEATAINNNRDVVGYSKGPNGMRAFLWTQINGMHDLGVLPGGNFSRALGVNDAGAVVGSSTSSLGDRAFIWTGNGGMQDLNNLASLPLDAVLVEAHSINNQGQILAMGGAMDEHHGNGGDASQCAPAPPASFLLTPATR
jgi:probable HAF family extracellular repeat protein